MFQSLMQLGILTYYSFNVDEIEARFCINKDKPDMCCKGKCYISKQLDGNQQEIPNSRMTEEREIPFFVLPINQRILVYWSKQVANEYNMLTRFSGGFKQQTFQPPELV